MKLKDLAEKAARLPDLDFDWSGPEQYHPDVFLSETNDLPSLRIYVEKLKDRIADQSRAIMRLKKGYEILRDIILEADIEGL